MKQTHPGQGGVRGGQALRLTRLNGAVLLAVLALAFPPVRALAGAIPPAEKLLSQDTLLMLTAPDFPRLSGLWRQTPQCQLWNDPAMKPFRDHVLSQWEEELVQPLQRELGINVESFTNLLQGQVTLALVRDSTPGQELRPLGLLLLADAKDKSEQLKQTLAKLRQKWVETGRASKTEKVRNLDFSVLSWSTNDLPKPLQRLLRQPPQFQGGGPVDPGPAGAEPARAAPRSEVIIGQVDSMLIVATSMKAVEQVVARLTGGSAPALEELAIYQANQQRVFRDAPLYGWMNAQLLLTRLTRQSAGNGGSDTPSVFDAVKPERLLNALGLGALNGIAFSVQDSPEGASLQAFFGAPDAQRRGLSRLFTPDTKEASPPPFIPAETLKFVRWRSDGQKAWATLQQLLGELSPQMLGGVNFLLDSAEARAREKEPGFDLRKFLVGSLGDDLISFEKAATGSAPADVQSPPSLVLVGSPQPENLAVALKALLVIFPQGDTITEREFLGHKVFSVPLPNFSMALPSSARPMGASTLSVAACGGYVAISTDTSMLEAYLRSTDTPCKPLRETPGLLEAAQKVGGMGTGWFGYENQAEVMRANFDTWRKNGDDSSAGPGGSPLGAVLGTPGAVKAVEGWMDFSLLPPFERVSQYFGFTVYAVSANVDGLNYKLFAPVPAALRK